jgi:methionyl-tRNA synthetase
MMAMASGIINPPYDVPANQYLNLNGKQFSKSTGNYVDAEEAVAEFGQDALRYYLLAILPETADASFAWEGLAAKNNNELANNIGNLVARCLKFMAKNWPALPGENFTTFAAEAERTKLRSIILDHQAALDSIQIRKGLELVMHLGQEANLYFTEQAPWGQFKTDPALAAKTVANTIAYIIVIADLLTPYLPNLSYKILASLGLHERKAELSKLYQGDLAALAALVQDGITLVAPPEILVPKIDDKVIAAKAAALAGGNK